ncbi:MAG TPA: peptide ABC transporter permease [Roseiarcus sp.]|nr:peptide ABC transporter permease [Roseiarcus sp.]
MAEEEENTGPKTYPADKARQGDIILRTPARRWIFIGGMLAALILVLIAQYLYLK